MMYNVYSYFDLKGRKYSAPFIAQNKEVAIRIASIVVKNDNIMSEFPNDFELHELGLFNDDSGFISGSSSDNSFVINLGDVYEVQK